MNAPVRRPVQPGQPLKIHPLAQAIGGAIDASNRQWQYERQYEQMQKMMADRMVQVQAMVDAQAAAPAEGTFEQNAAYVRENLEVFEVNPTPREVATSEDFLAAMLIDGQGVADVEAVEAQFDGGDPYPAMEIRTDHIVPEGFVNMEPVEDERVAFDPAVTPVADAMIAVPPTIDATQVHRFVDGGGVTRELRGGQWVRLTAEELAAEVNLASVVYDTTPEAAKTVELLAEVEDGFSMSAGMPSQEEVAVTSIRVGYGEIVAPEPRSADHVVETLVVEEDAFQFTDTEAAHAHSEALAEDN